MGVKNLSLVDELRVAERRLVNQETAFQNDENFLKDKKLVEAMPATAAAIRTRMLRQEKVLRITRELVKELRKGTGALPSV